MCDLTDVKAIWAGHGRWEGAGAGDEADLALSPLALGPPAVAQQQARSRTRDEKYKLQTSNLPTNYKLPGHFALASYHIALLDIIYSLR